jgi:hypothetical protein
MVMEKQSGMATKHTSAKSHGSAGKLGAVNDAASRAAEKGKKEIICVKHIVGTGIILPRKKPRGQRLLLLTGRHFRHVYDVWYDGPRQRLQLGRVNIHVPHGLNRCSSHTVRGLV